METFELHHTTSGIAVQVARFAGSRGAEEYHLCIEPGRSGTFEQQLRSLGDAYRFTLEVLKLPEDTAVLRRLFMSDCANQMALLEGSPLVQSSEENPVAISIVEQPPLPDHRVALWAYHLSTQAPLRKEPCGTGVLVHRDQRGHLWTTGLRSLNGGSENPSYGQSQDIFSRYQEELAGVSAKLQDHVIRTWLFVQNIDVNYPGMVDARRELFEDIGLTADTHFIASTGIEGRSADPRFRVLMDAYAIADVDPGQIRFLRADDHLGKTSDYGVTFERGVRVDHGDRSHVFISGTASIDPKGKTLHERDVRRQVARTLLNIERLLDDAGATSDDIAQLIIYARDTGDREPILDSVLRQYPGVPRVTVRAPVCRPNWLVEIEGIAIVEGHAPDWPDY